MSRRRWSAWPSGRKRATRSAARFSAGTSPTSSRNRARWTWSWPCTCCTTPGPAAKLLRFLRVCHDALRPGGRIVGFNDNVLRPPRGTVSWRQYGLEKTGPPSAPNEGDPIHYRFTNPDGGQFEFHNFFLKPETYDDAFRETGFRDFRWLGVSLEPDERNNPFWDDFLANPPVIAYAATK